MSTSFCLCTYNFRICWPCPLVFSWPFSYCQLWLWLRLSVDWVNSLHCVLVMAVNTGPGVYSYTATQLRHYRDMYPVPLLLSSDQLIVCRNLGLVKKRTQRGTCGRKKQRRVEVIVTLRVDYETASTRMAPWCTFSDNNAHKKSKARFQASNLTQVKLGKKEHTTSSQSTCLKVMCVKAQSCRQKSMALCDAISDNELDVALFTETWLYSQG